MTVLCGTKNDYVEHGEIVDALLHDAELGKLLDRIEQETLVYTRENSGRIQ